MKKILIFLAAASITGMGQSVLANPTAEHTQEDNKNGQITLMNSDLLHTTEIDGIEVPFEVLTYAHTIYLGHAITGASEVQIGTKKFYRLKLEHDTQSNENAIIHLFYDLEWRLVEKDDLPEIVKPESRRNADSEILETSFKEQPENSTSNSSTETSPVVEQTEPQENQEPPRPPNPEQNESIDRNAQTEVEEGVENSNETEVETEELEVDSTNPSEEEISTDESESTDN